MTCKIKEMQHLWSLEGCRRVSSNVYEESRDGRAGRRRKEGRREHQDLETLLPAPAEGERVVSRAVMWPGRV